MYTFIWTNITLGILNLICFLIVLIAKKNSGITSLNAMISIGLMVWGLTLVL
jgi:hypothetical protein